MEIIAYGVQADEQPLLRAAFETSHQLRTLAVFLNADTAPPTSASPLPGSPTTPLRRGRARLDRASATTYWPG
ncbi:hypothetical protein ACFQ0T_38425 [Kitasatospora gansuensis]